MTAKDIKDQAGFCRTRADDLRDAALDASDANKRNILLNLAESYESRAEALQGRLGPQGRWDLQKAG